jgi:hypothetical protein
MQTWIYGLSSFYTQHTKSKFIDRVENVEDLYNISNISFVDRSAGRWRDLESVYRSV